MAENKTAEEILLKHTSPMLHHYQGAIIAMEEYANFKLTQQQEINAELQKQNEELVEALKILRQQSSDLYDHCIDRGYLDNEDLTEGQELLLDAFELANKIINTPPKN